MVHLGTMVSPAGRRRVAIKQLLANGDPAIEDGARLVAEAQLVFQLTHGNICQVIDLAVSDDATFIVMEYVDGLDLRTLLGRLAERGLGLDVATAIYIVREIAQALDYAHRRTNEDGSCLWLVHGDVTPQNILLSREGEVKLADFGIARALGTLAPGNQMLGGTPGFIAPEAADGGAIDQRADIYSLGVTLYTALGGTSPERGLNLGSLTTSNAEATEELLAVVARATAKRPQDRFSTAGEMDRALALSSSKIGTPFSTSVLGELVRRHAQGNTAEVMGDAKATLTSLHSRNIAASSVVASRSVGHKQTRKATKPARRPSLKMIIGLTALGIIALAGGSRLLVVPKEGLAPAPESFPRLNDWREHSVTLPSEPSSSPVPPEPPTPPPTPPPAPIEHQKPARVEHRPNKPNGSPLRNRHARSSVSPEQALPRNEVGFLTVNAYPWGAVFVDGNRIAHQTPVYRIPVASGKHRIHVFNPDRNAGSPPQSVMVRSGENTTVGFDW